MKIRDGNVVNRPIYLALGVTVDGARDILGCGPASTATGREDVFTQATWWRQFRRPGHGHSWRVGAGRSRAVHRRSNVAAVGPDRARVPLPLKATEALARVAAMARRARAFHPRGVTFHATLRVFGRGDHGVELLDRAAEYQALVRLSRATSLPTGWPDAQGFALRILGAGQAGPADLLASTAMSTAPVARHVLFPRRRIVATYTTLAGYDTRKGRCYLAVLPDPSADDLGTDLRQLAGVATGGRARLLLAAASRTDPWRLFGRVTLGEPVASDVDKALAFDPIMYQVPGLRANGFLWSLRAAAYRGSRTGRGAQLPTN